MQKWWIVLCKEPQTLHQTFGSRVHWRWRNRQVFRRSKLWGFRSRFGLSWLSAYTTGTIRSWVTFNERRFRRLFHRSNEIQVRVIQTRQHDRVPLQWMCVHHCSSKLARQLTQSESFSLWMLRREISGFQQHGQCIGSYSYPISDSMSQQHVGRSLWCHKLQGIWGLRRVHRDQSLCGLRCS